MAQIRPDIDHLLRRAGFGSSALDVNIFKDMSVARAVQYLVDYETHPDDVDERIGRPDHAQVSSKDNFAPDIDIEDARQRWIFRMIHTRRPLQEKMTLFWHNHFATAFSKLNADSGNIQGAKLLAHKPGTLRGPQGQIELFRQHALGNFRNLLIEVAKDPAMVIWLDGKTNTKAKPQENFGREIMELFTMGVGNYTEEDVYAAARVFTGWNLPRQGSAADGSQHYEFVYVPAQHDTAAKTFSFPIYPNGGKTIPARGAADGMQDGLDFIDGLAAHPATGRYLAKKLFKFFVSEFREPDNAFIERINAVYQQSRYDMRSVVREVFLSQQFWDDASFFARYAWPVEFVVRALKDVGWVGFSVDTALAPLANMGQVLYEPPDVSGWDAGTTWFATGAMLARMNFASTLAANQRFNVASAAKSSAATPEGLLSYFQNELVTAPTDGGTSGELLAYLRATGAWTGSDAQVQSKSAGLVHLIAGSPEYQLV